MPARIWLINVGGEGQLHIGALFATWGALTFSDLAGMAAPADDVRARLPRRRALGGHLRASCEPEGWVSETISTLLMNYVAILLVQFVVFGPWKDPEGVNYPQTAEFAAAAILPTLGASRVHLGLVFALVGLGVYAFVVARTRWGLEMRAIGGNVEAARRAGIPIGRYVVVLMLVGGGLAGLAGMSEVSAIQGRLRSEPVARLRLHGVPDQLDGRGPPARHSRSVVSCSPSSRRAATSCR